MYMYTCRYLTKIKYNILLIINVFLNKKNNQNRCCC